MLWTQLEAESYRTKKKSIEWGESSQILGTEVFVPIECFEICGFVLLSWKVSEVQ